MNARIFADDCWIFQPDLSFFITMSCFLRYYLALIFFCSNYVFRSSMSLQSPSFSIFQAMIEFNGFLISCETQALIMVRTALCPFSMSQRIALDMSINYSIILSLSFRTNLDSLIWKQAWSYAPLPSLEKWNTTLFSWWAENLSTISRMLYSL